MDAGRDLSVFDCVAIYEHSNQSKSATLGVVMEAQLGLPAVCRPMRENIFIQINVTIIELIQTTFSTDLMRFTLMKFTYYGNVSSGSMQDERIIL
jgi:hypothetical protein